jgi:DNA-binding NtrC family response regulator
MPGVDGMELLGYCRTNFPGLPVILITAHGTVDTAVEAIKLGAHDYITKPFDQTELQQVIAKALATEEADRSKLLPDDSGRFDIIGRTPGMHTVYGMIDRVARSPTSILVTGESGTGKELVALAIHDNSARRDCPFIRVNCGAIPENLFESELFGHERGAFTGAVSSRPGRFELADGGTLFLDEIGELPKDMQVKLLRVLQDQTFERVGGIRSISVDVRLIAATNRDLLANVKAGTFRDDLYYRLNVIPIHLPALRDRADDIPLLVEHFLQKFNKRLERNVEGLSPEAMTTLMAWNWPGNIRELENLMERAILLSDESILTPKDLPGLEASEFTDIANMNPSSINDLGLKEYVRVYTSKLERARIERTLTEEAWNVTRAAKKLDISRKSLQIKMKEYGLRTKADEARGRKSET